jgi:hypothetical protein
VEERRKQTRWESATCHRVSLFEVVRSGTGDRDARREADGSASSSSSCDRVARCVVEAQLVGKRPLLLTLDVRAR